MRAILHDGSFQSLTIVLSGKSQPHKSALAESMKQNTREDPAGEDPLDGFQSNRVASTSDFPQRQTLISQAVWIWMRW